MPQRHFTSITARRTVESVSGELYGSCMNNDCFTVGDIAEAVYVPEKEAAQCATPSQWPSIAQ